MRNKLAKIGGGFLILMTLLSGAGFAQNFKFDIKPHYTDYTGVDLTKYEVGSSLLKAYIRVMTTSGTLNLRGVKAALGYKNPSGFEYSKIEASGKEEYSGFNWNTQLGGLTYDNTKGEIYYSRGTVAGQAGKDIGTSAENMYRIDFKIKDVNANEGPSLLKFDNPYGSAGGENSASDPTTNKLTAEDNFNFDILTAAPPQNFAGAASVTDTQVGNTLQIGWTALSNKIGEKDWTPPIKYDIYRSTLSSFTPDDSTGGNRVLYDQSPSSGFDYTGGAYSALDGPNTGVPGSGVNQLSDCTTYYYIMRAKDSTTNPDSTSAPQHKTTNADTVIVSGTPHDYTPPAAPTITKIEEGDGSVTLTWSNPSDTDFAGVIVVRKPDGSEPNPTLQSASGNDNGTTYSVGDTLSDGSVVKYKGTGTTFADASLTNGVNYKYKIYAFDLATDGPPKQQGNNYSAAASSEKSPGVAPDDVQNVRALADPSTGDITLKWTNPILDAQGNVDSSKAGGYGGAKIVYTTAYSKWKDVAYDSAAATPGIFKEKEQLIPDSAATSKTPSQESLTISNLSTTEVYYFKLFSFNITPDPATRKYSPGVMVAAIPLKGLGDIITKYITQEVPVYISGAQEVTITLKKKAASFGINTVALPFVPAYDENDFKVATMGDLVYKINQAAGKKEGETAVSTLGYWDKDDQLPVGFIFNDDGTVKLQKGTDKKPSEVPLQANVGYQIFVKETVPPFKLKGK